MLDSEWFVAIISLVMLLFHSQSEILTYAEENSWKHIPNKCRDSCADYVIGFTDPFMSEDRENLFWVKLQTPLLLLFKEIKVHVCCLCTVKFSTC